MLFPIAFVSEHSETLVELDIDYRHLAEQAGVPGYVRVPTVGTTPAFIAGLAALVRAAAGLARAGAFASRHGACARRAMPVASIRHRRRGRMEWLASIYPWLKALHIISVMAWMAGLLYLPRLFVYHASAAAGSPQSETFKVMERRLLRGIMNPAMGAAYIFGIAACC